jgi:chromosome segregation ATPase
MNSHFDILAAVRSRDTRSRSEQIKPDVSLLQAQMVCMEQELIALRQENEQLKSEQNEMAIKLMDAEDNVVNLKGELLEVLQVVDRLTGGIKPNR